MQISYYVNNEIKYKLIHNYYSNVQPLKVVVVFFFLLFYNLGHILCVVL